MFSRLLAVMIVVAGCASHPAPINEACIDKNKTCPLGTQKECTQRNDPCKCHCHQLNSDPYTPKQMEDQNRFGFPKEEKPSNHELQGPFEGE